MTFRQFLFGAAGWFLGIVVALLVVAAIHAGSTLAFFLGAGLGLVGWAAGRSIEHL